MNNKCEITTIIKLEKQKLKLYLATSTSIMIIMIIHGDCLKVIQTKKYF